MYKKNMKRTRQREQNVYNITQGSPTSSNSTDFRLNSTIHTHKTNALRLPYLSPPFPAPTPSLLGIQSMHVYFESGFVIWAQCCLHWSALEEWLKRKRVKRNIRLFAPGISRGSLFGRVPYEEVCASTNQSLGWHIYNNNNVQRGAYTSYDVLQNPEIQGDRYVVNVLFIADL